jgi:hypothetical protein
MFRVYIPQMFVTSFSLLLLLWFVCFSSGYIGSYAALDGKYYCKPHFKVRVHLLSFALILPPTHSHHTLLCECVCVCMYVYVCTYVNVCVFQLMLLLLLPLLFCIHIVYIIGRTASTQQLFALKVCFLGGCVYASLAGVVRCGCTQTMYVSRLWARRISLFRFVFFSFFLSVTGIMVG